MKKGRKIHSMQDSISASLRNGLIKIIVYICTYKILGSKTTSQKDIKSKLKKGSLGWVAGRRKWKIR